MLKDNAPESFAKALTEEWIKKSILLSNQETMDLFIKETVSLTLVGLREKDKPDTERILLEAKELLITIVTIMEYQRINNINVASRNIPAESEKLAEWSSEKVAEQLTSQLSSAKNQLVVFLQEHSLPQQEDPEIIVNGITASIYMRLGRVR